MGTVKLHRLSNWSARLTYYIDEVRFRPLQYGIFDCAIFPCGAIEAVTGVNYSKDFVGKYNTYMGGIKLLKTKYDVRDHVDLAAKWFKPRHWSLGAPGDLASATTELGRALGVVAGAHVFFLNLEGLGMIDLSEVDRIYKVG